MLNALRIEDFSVQVHLGCGKEERLVSQEVRVSLEIRFPELLKAAKTDELTDTICYADLCEAIRKIAGLQEYKLIEKLGLDCFQAVRELAGPGNQIALEIHKVRPPVQDLQGGSIYRLGDFWL
jgi:dihydroneopterin aldolase/2-amino-4-hydroxy-6-hydroxymethyldihydropteridine diphosphokinase